MTAEEVLDEPLPVNVSAECTHAKAAAEACVKASFKHSVRDHYCSPVWRAVERCLAEREAGAAPAVRGSRVEVGKASSSGALRPFCEQAVADLQRCASMGSTNEAARMQAAVLRGFYGVPTGRVEASAGGAAAADREVAA